MKKEVAEVLETAKSKVTKKRVFAVLKAVAAFLAVIAGGIGLLVRRGLKFLKKGGSNMNTMSVIALSCGSGTVAKNIEYGAFSCLLGCMNVSWPETPEQSVSLDVCSAFGMATVTVPANMRVVCDIKAVAGMVSNHAVSPDDENAPVLTITGKAIFGMITVRTADTAAECTETENADVETVELETTE